LEQIVSRASIILASSSASRKSLMQTLHLPFTCESPDIDESPLPGETVKDMVLRLSIEKARAIAKHQTHALVIGSDQSAITLADPYHFLGKPLTREKAFAQLRASSGQTLVFYTGLCVIDSRTQEEHTQIAETRVVMKNLSDTQIENYLSKEDALKCAGSFKSEGLGVALFDQLSESEPGALMGLPLISLVNFLTKADCDPLS
jgi:MAF protein